MGFPVLEDRSLFTADAVAVSVELAGVAGLSWADRVIPRGPNRIAILVVDRCDITGINTASGALKRARQGHEWPSRKDNYPRR